MNIAMDMERRPVTTQLELIEFPGRSEWQQWLRAHHDDSPGAWLLLAKKGAPRATVTQAEALEVAICFGWIDGQVGRHDEHFYKQRFTHRRARSKWSQINCRRAERLIADGLMQPPGLEEIERAKAGTALGRRRRAAVGGDRPGRLRAGARRRAPGRGLLRDAHRRQALRVSLPDPGREAARDARSPDREVRGVARGGCWGDAGTGEDVEAEVAASFGPFVVLFGKDGANEADQRVAAGEDADHVGAAADLPVQPLLRVVAPDLPPEFFREAGERQDVGRAASRCAATLGSLSVMASMSRSYWACTDVASGWS